MSEKILLAIGITLLFLGVSVNPAIAVNPISTDNEEDCDICPKVSKPYLFRLRSLLNRLETPIFEEKYQELFDRFITPKEINMKISPPLDQDPAICENLVSTFNNLISRLIGVTDFLIYDLLEIIDYIFPGPIIYMITEIFIYTFLTLRMIFWGPPLFIMISLIILFDCEIFDPYSIK